MGVRQVVLDTETTGLEVQAGHRVIEIGCLEIVDRRPTGRHWHVYLNPQRRVDEGALAVHGLTDEFLADKPRFAEVHEQLLAFIGGAELLIHNASFDEAFLDAELDRLGLPGLRAHCDSICDTLPMARELHPGKRNSLDALCDRYGVSNAHRTLHGALLDSQLLAEVYLAMTRGQESFEIGLDAQAQADADAADGEWPPAALAVVAATPEEAAAHEAWLDALAKGAKKPPVWRRAAA